MSVKKSSRSAHNHILPRRFLYTEARRYKMSNEEIINKGIQAGYNVELAKQFGITIAIVLNRLVFLHKNTPRDDGFTWQTAKDWEEYTGLSDYQVKKALDKLVSLNIIELKNTYIIGTQIKCRHQRFIIKSETKETSIPVNSIEHIIEPIKEHKDRNSKEAEELAKLLRIEILKRYPNNLGANKKDCIKRWANDIEKMIRLDKRTPENIKSAILWALNDSFWQKNIWSGANLRKHYDKLEAEAKAKFLKYGTITV